MKKNKKSQLKAEKELTPITVYVCAAGLGVIGYFVGEIALRNSQPHPVHWLAGIVGIGIGYLLGKLLVRRYGDMFGF